MRDHSAHIEMNRNQAVRAMLSALETPGFDRYALHPCEQISLDHACGRTLAADVCARIDVPNALTCALDSIAVHWDDFADLADGALPDTTSWVRGKDWEFANTGVAMPEGFDTAIVIEHVTVSPDEQSITIDAAPSERFAGTRAVGSTMHAGDLVVSAGTLITPEVASQIAGAGHTCVMVRRKPRVSFLPTGNELISPDAPYDPNEPEKFAGRGHVFESNSYVVRGKVERWGGTLVPFDIVPDERDAIKRALEHAADVSDIIVLNAGSSKGSDDWSVEVLEEIGEIICHQTNHGPGHHSSYALLRREERVVPVVGISGPPAGASFTLDFYLRPIIKLFLGLDPTPITVAARLAGTFGPNRFARHSKPRPLSGEQRPPEATEPGAQFFSVRFMELAVTPSGELTATPVPGRPGSLATQHAQALFMVPAGPDATPPTEGDIIKVELRDK